MPMNPETPTPSGLLVDMWHAAVAAARPAACLGGHWPAEPAGRLAVIACGKAAWGMAADAVRQYGKRCTGLVILPDAPGAAPGPMAGMRIVPASHPVPDERSEAAARAALALASDLSENDLLLVLLSGGGSALMSLPAAGVSLAEKQVLTRRLLASGATIGEINCVRKHLSHIKGGRLAQASRAPVVTLAISDVPGDDPALIASGPTVSDRSTPAEALAVLARYAIEPGPAVRRSLDRPARSRPPPAGSGGADRYRVVASGMTALRAAENWCRSHGIEPVCLGDRLQDEARQLAEDHARMVLDLARRGRRACLLSGGETTVRLALNPGRGGRNTEYALALAIALAGQTRIWALAADTDGIDGFGGHSGATVDPDLLRRAAGLGLNAEDHLRRNDSASLFARAGGLLTEGPTGTNVNDFRAILVYP